MTTMTLPMIRWTGWENVYELSSSRASRRSARRLSSSMTQLRTSSKASRTTALTTGRMTMRTRLRNPGACMHRHHVNSPRPLRPSRVPSPSEICTPPFHRHTNSLHIPPQSFPLLPQHQHQTYRALPRPLHPRRLVPPPPATGAAHPWLSSAMVP